MLGSKRSGIFGLYNIAYWAAVGSFILLEGTGCMNTLETDRISVRIHVDTVFGLLRSQGGREGGREARWDPRNPRTRLNFEDPHRSSTAL